MASRNTNPYLAHLYEGGRRAPPQSRSKPAPTLPSRRRQLEAVGQPTRAGPPRHDRDRPVVTNGLVPKPSQDKTAAASPVVVKPSDSLPFPHGNYSGYYGFRPIDSDPRLAMIPGDDISNKVVLDIGCNSGALTLRLASLHRPKWMLGIDLDGHLIRDAARHAHHQYSLAGGPDDEPGYFPDAMVAIHGITPLPDEWGKDGYLVSSLSEASDLVDRARKHVRWGEDAGGAVLPDTLRFATADVAKDDLSALSGQFDTILALSVTKWIHLHGRDNGIREFFRTVNRLLVPGGAFIVEPQPFDSYLKSKLKKFNPHELQFRPDAFSTFLTSLGFDPLADTHPDTTTAARGFETRHVQRWRKRATSPPAPARPPRD